MSRYVVTGAAGFIGSHLTEALLARGDDVRAVDSFTEYYDPALKEENARAFTVERVDLADADLELGGVEESSMREAIALRSAPSADVAHIRGPGLVACHDAGRGASRSVVLGGG